MSGCEASDRVSEVKAPVVVRLWRIHLPAAGLGEKSHACRGWGRRLRALKRSWTPGGAPPYSLRWRR